MIEILSCNKYKIKNKATNEIEIYKLAFIDCPEVDEPFGFEAKEFIRKLLIGKNIFCVIEKYEDEDEQP